MSPIFQHANTSLDPGITVIAASAGTGKTFTLAALVTRLVAELGIPIRRLLLTTYTVAATAELRDRIRARLIQANDAIRSGTTNDEFLAALIPGLPSEATDRLDAAIRDFDEASIHTIHGFCQRALKELAFETGAPFAPELLADTTALYNEVAEDYWRQHIYPAPALVAASLASTELSPEVLRKQLRSVSGQDAIIIPDASEYDKARAALLDTHQEFCRKWPGWCDSAKERFIDGNDWGNKNYYKDDLKVRLEALARAAAESATAVEFLNACSAYSHLTSKAVWGGTNKRKKKEPIEHPLLELCDRFARASVELHDATLSHFLAWARIELEKKKAERGILLFDDLLVRLHESLKANGTTGTQLGSRYDAVLVDEFQDTDPVQAQIFLEVFGTEQHRLMLIGDPKQAIYAFRGADLFAYLSAVDRASRHFTLKQNQRSTTTMVAAVNHLFDRPATPFLDKRIPFEPVDAAGRANKSPLRIEEKTRPPFHFWLWEGDERIPTTVALRKLPELTAQSVAHFLASGATIGGNPAKPGDCAVLCRSNTQARDVATELSRAGIPAVVLSDANVFASEEAVEFRLLLASLSDPNREALLRSALTIPALGHTMATLLAMDADPAKWDEIRLRWHSHYECWRDRDFIRMFRQFLRQEGVRPRLLAYPDGERRLTNLQHLAELAHIAAETQHLGTSGVLHWLDQEMESKAGNPETELRLDRDDSAVRVITVHKSKGLEYPVVFCPYLWTNSELRKNGPIRFHDDQGRMTVDLRANRDPANEARAQEEQFAEDIRLLYVALTRARHECHVVWGAFGNGRKKDKEPEVSALLHLLEPVKGTATFGALAASAEAIPPARFAGNIAALCEHSPTLFACHTLPPPETTLPEPVESTPMEIAARPISRKIDHTWKAMSYSGLHAGIEDAIQERRAVDPSTLRGIHAFPRGIQAGSCLHDVLQHVEFAEDAKDVPEFLERKLRQHAMFSAENVAALESMIGEIRAALPANAVTRGTSLRELEFHLPAGLLTPAVLEEYAGGSLKFDEQRGILTGIIDLVYEHDGQFHIVDWKSNWLGATADAYTPAAMATAMQRHRYGLQRQIYLFALHRQLQLRVPSYDPGIHLGGASYVFLRGLDRTKPGQGIVHVVPEPSTLSRMERLFPSP